MQTRGEKWLGRTEAHATFEVAWHEAAGKMPEAPTMAPSERQVDNYLGSGLPATKLENGLRKFERGSVQRIAQVHVEGGGRFRPLHVMEQGQWGDLWRLHRAFSENGVVLLVNRAYAEALTGYPRRTLQRILESGGLTCSIVGNTYFIPKKALDEYVRVGRDSSSNQGGSGSEQVPIERFLAGAVTSHGIDLIYTPL